MNKNLMSSMMAFSVIIGIGVSTIAVADDWKRDWRDKRGHQQWGTPKAQLGPRPFFLVDNMDDSRLKRTLKQCENGPFYRTDFSIGHRGAPLQFPEHTVESYLAAARMGSGILECDVTWSVVTRSVISIRRRISCSSKNWHRSAPSRSRQPTLRPAGRPVLGVAPVTLPWPSSKR